MKVCSPETGIAEIETYWECVFVAQTGLATRSMFLNLRSFSKYNTPSFDDRGQLLVGAAVGTRECDKERVKRLVEQGNVDLIVLDSSQGDSTFQGQMLEFIKTEYPSRAAL